MFDGRWYGGTWYNQSQQSTIVYRQIELCVLGWGIFYLGIARAIRIVLTHTKTDEPIAAIRHGGFYRSY